MIFNFEKHLKNLCLIAEGKLDREFDGKNPRNSMLQSQGTRFMRRY